MEVVGRFRELHPLETLSDKNSGFAVAHTAESQRDQKVSRPPTKYRRARPGVVSSWNVACNFTDEYDTR